MPENVGSRSSGSFMVDMGISSNIMKSPLPNVTRNSGIWPYTMTPLMDQTLHQFANLLPNWTILPILTLLPNFGGFQRTLQRVWLANRGRLLLRTSEFVLMLRPFFPELVMSTDLFSFKHPSVLLFCLFSTERDLITLILIPVVIVIITSMWNGSSDPNYPFLWPILKVVIAFEDKSCKMEVITCSDLLFYYQ